MNRHQSFPINVSELGEYAFPKISGKRRDFLNHLRSLAEAGRLAPVIDMEGTVKLHGMHADIVFDLRDLASLNHNNSRGNTRNIECHDTSSMNAVLSLSEKQPALTTPGLNVSFQSRNRFCDPDASTHGWPRNVAKEPGALLYLRDRILQRFNERNPTKKVSYSCPLIVAGEWVGPKVQQDVGVSLLSHRFVILTIQINGKWQRDSDYDDIEASKASIYSIFRAGQQTIRFDTRDLTDNNPALLEMQRIADQVEECCPFAASFNINNSQGEGVVWKPGCLEGRANPKYWLKTKGPISGPENRIDAQNIEVDEEKKISIDQMCLRFVSPRRVDQGFEYLLETGVEPNRQSLKIFVNWVLSDVMVEEKSEIDEMGKAWKGVQGLVNKKVKTLARNAFIDQMEKCGVSIAWVV